MKLICALVAAGLASPVFAQAPAVQTPSGPAMLTRGEAPAAMVTPQVAFRPYLQALGVYDTGLTGVSVDQAGQLGSSEAFGGELTFGVSGAHSWRHTKVGLEYRGSARHYSKKTYYDGTDQSLMLGVTRQFTRHTSLTLRESAGLFSRSFGLYGLSQTVPFDPSTAYIPSSDFYDNRTIYLSTQADFTIQKSARLSFNIGGDGFVTRRRSSALYGVTGGGARGDLQYRLSRRSTIGLAYNFTKYSFHNVLSNTDLHSVVLSYGNRLTRTLELTGYAGALRSETQLLESVQLDPAIAALIGRSTGSVIAHRIDYVPHIGARLSRTFERGVAYISGGRSVTPGNGLFLTSTSTSASAGYTYTGLRRWSFNMQAGYQRSNSIGNVIGDYGSTTGGFSLSRQLGRVVHIIATFNARDYNSPDFSLYNRLIYTARLGLGFTPGDIPLRFW